MNVSHITTIVMMIIILFISAMLYPRLDHLYLEHVPDKDEYETLGADADNEEVLMYYCIILLYFYYIILHHYIIISLYHYIIISLYHYRAHLG